MQTFIKRWGCLSVVLGFVLVAGVFYWGWCWGWWGRGNLLLQSWFQCRCPAASEAVRYHPFKVLASACVKPFLYSFSPSGRFVIVSAREPKIQVLRFDLETGQTLSTHLEDKAINDVRFLNDNLLLVRLAYGQGYSLLDVNDGALTKIPSVEYDLDSQFNHLESTTLVTVKQAEQVIVTGDIDNSLDVVALTYDYKQHPERGIVIHSSGFSSPKSLLKILNDEAITYSQVLLPYKAGSLPGAYYSIGGEIWADDLGVYSTTKELIVATGQSSDGRPYNFGPAGWMLNDQAVVYGTGGSHYLIEGSGIFPAQYPVPQPILLLEVPPEYWPTTP